MKPDRSRYDLVVIGAGAAGSEAAFAAASPQKRILLIEARHFGGTCTNHGCVPTKALVRAARILHQARRAHEYGLRIAEPSFDWEAVLRRVQGVRDHMLRCGASPFQERGIEVVYPATARLLGERSVEVDGAEVCAERVVLASGLQPAVPPVPGLAESLPLDNETALELTELPASLAVIGGGPIGCEFAQILARFGVRVIVLEVLDRILASEEPESSAAIASAFRDEGIEVVTGARIRAVERRDGKRSIQLESGRRLEVEEILVAAGRQLDGAALGLDAAGIEWTPKGVRADARLQTSQPWAWAAGDVVGGPLFTHVASEMGQIAGRNSSFGEAREIDLRVLPRATFTDPEVASVGLTEAQANEAGHAVKVGFAPLAEAEKAQIDGSSIGHVKVVADAISGELLGCHIVAEDAADMIHEAVALMAGRSPIDGVAAAMHAYPTLSELMRSALSAARP